MKTPENRAGQLLRHYRLRRGLTQAEVAKKVNITTGYMTMLERGLRTRPSDKVIDALAKSLKLNTAEKEELRAELQHEGRAENAVLPPIKISPLMNTLAEFLQAPRDSTESHPKLLQFIEELRAMAGQPVRSLNPTETARLLTMGYLCELPTHTGKPKSGRKTKQLSVREQELLWAKELHGLVEMLFDDRLTLRERINLTRETASFGRWKAEEMRKDKVSHREKF